jgi:hypothetical protein
MSARVPYDRSRIRREPRLYSIIRMNTPRHIENEIACLCSVQLRAAAKHGHKQHSIAVCTCTRLRENRQATGTHACAPRLGSIHPTHVNARRRTHVNTQTNKCTNTHAHTYALKHTYTHRLAGTHAQTYLTRTARSLALAAGTSCAADMSCIDIHELASSVLISGSRHGINFQPRRARALWARGHHGSEQRPYSRATPRNRFDRRTLMSQAGAA